MLGVVTQDNESGLKEVKSERDLLPQKTFSTKGTNTEIAAVGNDRFLTWLFNKAYNVCMKEKERTVVEEADVNPMTVVSPHQAVEGEEDGMEVSEKCGDAIVDISVPSDVAADDHEIDLIYTAGTEALSSQSDHQLDESQDRIVCAPRKTLPTQLRKRKLTGNKKVMDRKKRKGTQSLQEKIMKVLKCMYCIKTFNSERNLTLHQREHTTEQSYTTKTMQSKIKKHLLSQSEKKRKRNKRDKAIGCKPRHVLNRHFRIHTGEKPYKCTVCKKAFSAKGDLKKHLQIHTRKKRYKCTACDQAFAERSNLKIHFRIHTGEKPYKCTVCDKAFSGKRDLKMHLRIHTGEKPYNCTVCDNAFSGKRDLNRHLRIHTGEKPYKCTACNKVFNRKDVLKKHLHIHV